MTTVLALGFGPYPGHAANPAQDIIDTLRAERWRPGAAKLATLVAPTMWWRSAEALVALARREGPDALIVFGHAPGRDHMLVAEAALNCAAAAPDRAGLHWPGREIAPGGAARLALPSAARSLARVIDAGGAPAETCADGGDYVWNRCAYMAASLSLAPWIAFVLAPTPLETARGQGIDGPAPLNRAQLMAGAQAAIRYAATAAERRAAAP